MGGGGWGKKLKKNHGRENIKKKIGAKRKAKKKNHAKGRSNCDFYFIYKICQCLLKIILIQNILGALPQRRSYPRENLPMSIKNNSYSKHTWVLTPGPALLLFIIHKDI